MLARPAESTQEPREQNLKPLGLLQNKSEIRILSNFSKVPRLRESLFGKNTVCVDIISQTGPSFSPFLLANIEICVDV